VIGIVIVAHGGLAQEYLAAIEHVVGSQFGVRAIAIEADHDRADKEREICTAADAVDQGAGVVVVTDLFGGSPSNLSLLACRPENRRIIYGANLANADQTRQIEAYGCARCRACRTRSW